MNNYNSSNPNVVVQKQLQGSAYDTVKTVKENLPQIEDVNTNINEIKNVNTNMTKIQNASVYASQINNDLNKSTEILNDVTVKTDDLDDKIEHINQVEQNVVTMEASVQSNVLLAQNSANLAKGYSDQTALDATTTATNLQEVRDLVAQENIDADQVRYDANRATQAVIDSQANAERAVEAGGKSTHNEARAEGHANLAMKHASEAMLSKERAEQSASDASSSSETSEYWATESGRMHEEITYLHEETKEMTSDLAEIRIEIDDAREEVLEARDEVVDKVAVVEEAVETINDIDFDRLEEIDQNVNDIDQHVEEMENNIILLHQEVQDTSIIVEANKDAAKVSELRAKQSEDNALQSETDALQYRDETKTMHDDNVVMNQEMDDTYNDFVLVKQEADSLTTIITPIRDEITTAQQDVLAAKAAAEQSEINAKASETNSLLSEQNSKASENQAIASEINAKASENLAKQYLDEVTPKHQETVDTYNDMVILKGEMDNVGNVVVPIRDETTQARDEAKASENASKLSENKAKISEDNALISENNAKASEIKSEQLRDENIIINDHLESLESNVQMLHDETLVSETNVKTIEGNIESMRDLVTDNKDKAKDSEDNAKQSELNAKQSEDNSLISENNARASEVNAKQSENLSKQYLDDAQAINVYLDQLKIDVDNMKTDVETSETEVKRIESDLLILEQNVIALDAQVTKNTTDVQGWHDDVDTMHSEVSSWHAQVDTWNTSIQNIKISIDTIYADIQAIETNVTTMESNVVAKHGEVVTLHQETEDNTELAEIYRDEAQTYANTTLITGIKPKKDDEPFNIVIYNQTNIKITAFTGLFNSNPYLGFTQPVEVVFKEYILSIARSSKINYIIASMDGSITTVDTRPSRTNHSVIYLGYVYYDGEDNLNVFVVPENANSSIERREKGIEVKNFSVEPTDESTLVTSPYIVEFESANWVNNPADPNRVRKAGNNPLEFTYINRFLIPKDVDNQGISNRIKVNGTIYDNNGTDDTVGATNYSIQDIFETSAGEAFVLLSQRVWDDIDSVTMAMSSYEPIVPDSTKFKEGLVHVARMYVRGDMDGTKSLKDDKAFGIYKLIVSGLDHAGEDRIAVNINFANGGTRTSNDNVQTVIEELLRDSYPKITLTEDFINSTNIQSLIVSSNIDTRYIYKCTSSSKIGDLPEDIGTLQLIKYGNNTANIMFFGETANYSGSYYNGNFFGWIKITDTYDKQTIDDLILDISTNKEIFNDYTISKAGKYFVSNSANIIISSAIGLMEEIEIVISSTLDMTTKNIKIITENNENIETRDGVDTALDVVEAGISFKLIKKTLGAYSYQRDITEFGEIFAKNITTENDNNHFNAATVQATFDEASSELLKATNDLTIDYVNTSSDLTLTRNNRDTNIVVGDTCNISVNVSDYQNKDTLIFNTQKSDTTLTISAISGSFKYGADVDNTITFTGIHSLTLTKINGIFEIR